MEFRLSYQGQLRAEGRTSHPKEKHHIRKILHKQLAGLWQTDYYLKQYFGDRHKDSRGRPPIHRIADNYARCGFRFVPLIGDRFGSLGCALDILFLRRDQPGDIVKSGGDIDNRIKVLFDALKIPQECNELPRSVKPDPDEDPFFCLLQDDKLIVEVKITTDRLLMPLAADEHIHDVHLIVHVRTVRLMDQAFSRRLDD